MYFNKIEKHQKWKKEKCQYNASAIINFPLKMLSNVKDNKRPKILGKEETTTLGDKMKSDKSDR